MNDTELEIRLREAAPDVIAPPSLSTQRARTLIKLRARRRHSRWAWCAGAAAAATLLGGGSAAIAASGFTTPWGSLVDNIFSFSTDAADCVSGYSVMPLDGQSSESYEEARDFVATLDLASLDASKIAWWERAIRDANERRTDQNGSLAPVFMTSAELRQQAIIQTVGELIADHLKSQGLPASYGADVEYRGCGE